MKEQKQKKSKLKELNCAQTFNNSKRDKVNNGRNCYENCVQHQFCLRPFNEYISSTFGRQIKGVKHKYCFRNGSSSMPIIQHQFWNRYEIPIFILQRQKPEYDKKYDLVKRNFQQAVKEAERNERDQQEPQFRKIIPNKKNCHLCFISIEKDEDYERHIEMFEHKRRIAESKGQKYIEQMIGELNRSLKFEEEKKRKKKEIQKEKEKQMGEIFQLRQIIGATKKIIKNMLLRRQARNIDRKMKQEEVTKDT